MGAEGGSSILLCVPISIISAQSVYSIGVYKDLCFSCNSAFIPSILSRYSATAEAFRDFLKLWPLAIRMIRIIKN